MKNGEYAAFSFDYHMHTFKFGGGKVQCIFECGWFGNVDNFWNCCFNKKKNKKKKKQFNSQTDEYEQWFVATLLPSGSEQQDAHQLISI